MTLLICLITLACENEIDTTPNVFPPAVEQTEVDMDLTPQEPGACDDCLTVGSWYRFDLLALGSLDRGPHPVIAILNNLWEVDVNNHVLNVLFEVRAIEGDLVTIGAMNAAWVNEEEDGYCVLPDTQIEFIFKRDGCSIINEVTAGINIYAGSTSIPKNCSPDGEAVNAIPVRDVTLAADFTQDCSSIINGSVVSAAIKKSALEETCSCLNGNLEGCVGPDPDFPGNNFGECQSCNSNYQSLSRQLNTIQQLEWLCEVNGEQAVCLEGSFSAQQLDFTPPVCP
jgi:hypothetical protein